jgi:hypothetical protein
VAAKRPSKKSNRRPAKRPKTARPRKTSGKTTRPREEELQGPPPREATRLRDDRERQAWAELARYTAASPRLTGGDVDADWRRADAAGEEGVGGTVATPDQDTVDDLGEALGVPRAPDEEFRTSQEILERRDRSRGDQEDSTA